MKSLKGFTLSEVIIVVAVLAIVFTMAMPDMTRLFDRHNQMTEINRLNEIRRALELYVKDDFNGFELPPENNWYNDLAKYTKLSAEQIRYDVWDSPTGNRRERRYKKFTDTKSYLGSSYIVNYAAVLSDGVDKTADVITPKTLIEFRDLDATTSVFAKSGEDYAVKYTDQEYKVTLIEQTLDRLDRLTTALEKYARSRQISGISYAENHSSFNADDEIYFPADGNTADSGNYFTEVPGGYADLNSSEANDAVQLAKKLGLPEDYGKDALTNRPMMYVSNPGTNTSGDLCIGGRSQAPYFPPIIKLDTGSIPNC